MMDKGMLVDMEHMSDRSVDQTLVIAEQRGAPVMLSHAWFRDLKLPRHAVRHSRLPDKLWNEQKAEMHRSADTLRRVSALGGVVGVITNQGMVAVPATEPQPVANDCDTSAKSFAQAYLYAVAHMGTGVGLGTDFNGLDGQAAPRFGPDACGGKDVEPATQTVQARRQIEEAECVQYENATINGVRLDRSVAGHRVFDFNCDGLAQYGMLPDLIADLRAVGVPAEKLDVLFHSAEAYVEMWEKARAAAEHSRGP
jgi:microsomal dipeptidase-like Zn-dependent dipeptidase